MGFNVFSDDWDRLRSGDLYLSDCTGLDRRLDRQLIEYIAIHGRGWWMPKFRRRYRIGETFPGPADGAGPDEDWSRYCVIREQAARENDSEMVLSGSHYIDENGVVIENLNYPVDRYPDYPLRRLSPHGKLYRRDFLDRHNIRFAPGKLYEDNPFTPQCFARAERIAYTAEPFYYLPRCG